MAEHYFMDKILRLNMFDSYFDVGHGILVTYMTYIMKTMMEARFFQNLFKLELTELVYCYRKQFPETSNLPIFPISVKMTG